MINYIKIGLHKLLPDRRKNFIKQCVLFEDEWYARANSLSKQEDPVLHYLQQGNLRSINPSPLFDANYYCLRRNRKLEANFTWLEDYLHFGWKKRISPTPYFNSEYYLELYKDVAGEGIDPLIHFLNFGWKEGRNPNPYFETAWYLEQYPDVKNLGINPLIHYIGNGYKEFRSPSPNFDKEWYAKRYTVNEQVDPLFHFLSVGISQGCFPNKFAESKAINQETHGQTSTSTEGTIYSELETYNSPGPFFVNRSKESPEWQYNLKFIAFYLPQFHEIKENNEWWGEGFTEWTNVTRGLPRFKGHFQPKLPRDLGFYDLSGVQTLNRQIEIAKQYGIFGFCFHYYWFSGKRLLDKPLDLFLEHKEIDFPFCICWANENWTKRWDGLDQEILIKQDFIEEDLSTFIPDLQKYLEDSRYIKIDGRPLIIIYRPTLIPKIKKVLESWKAQAKELGFGEPIWAAVQAFGLDNPTKLGFDLALEFPPHKVSQNLAPVNKRYELLDPNFNGLIIDTIDVIKKSEYFSAVTDFPLIKGVFPSWDNEARKKGSGITFVNSSPPVFKKWLRSCSQYATEKPVFGESIVFINAWNEWAEGAYLEPDQYNGYAYLDVVKNVAKKYNVSSSKFGEITEETKLGKANMKFLIVSHDAHRHGAQFIILEIAKTLHQQFGFEIATLLLDGGALEHEFRKQGQTFCLKGKSPGKNQDLSDFLFGLELNGFEHAICNSAVSGIVIPELKKANLSVISLIHELPSLIKEFKLGESCQYIARNSEKIIFPAKIVKKGFETFTSLSSTSTIIRPQGIYAFSLDDVNNIIKGALREELSIPAEDKIIISVGFADLRKGVDIFIKIANQISSKNKSIHFVWIGNTNGQIFHWMMHDLTRVPSKTNIHFLPFNKNISSIIADSDLYLLTSREDPFPSVVLEALALGKPVVAFDGSGGIVEINKNDEILELCPYLDANEMINRIEYLLSKEGEERYNTISNKAKDLINLNFWFDDYSFEIIQQFFPKLKRVSVIVPNYNYAHTLEDRLSSIWSQDYPIFETIILDDKSTDNSLAVIEQLAAKYNRTFRLFVNEENSGTPFAQWKKGIEKARGEFIWIAEADDLSKPQFLSELLQFFDDPEVGMAYCQSEQIDESGNFLAGNYLYYTNDLNKTKWTNNYTTDGVTEIEEALSIKNAILNVSSVLWRRENLHEILSSEFQNIQSFKVAGDWYIYIKFLMKNKVGFCSNSLNIHRRHKQSATIRLDAKKHIEEIKTIHKLIRELITPNLKLKKAMKVYLTELEQQFNKSAKKDQ